MIQRNKYDGPERRVHHVYVTRNTEYHVRRGVCVAVKQRNQREFMQDHGALRMHLDGHVKVGTLLPLPGEPKIGMRIYFATEESDILTSPVIAIIRPPKTVVAAYPPEK
jgi:hypothetical protein